MSGCQDVDIYFEGGIDWWELTVIWFFRQYCLILFQGYIGKLFVIFVVILLRYWCGDMGYTVWVSVIGWIVRRSIGAASRLQQGESINQFSSPSKSIHQWRRELCRAFYSLFSPVEGKYRTQNTINLATRVLSLLNELNTFELNT